jgi:hypothetical protein
VSPVIVCSKLILKEDAGWKFGNLLAKIVHEVWTPAMHGEESRKADSGNVTGTSPGGKVIGVEKIQGHFHHGCAVGSLSTIALMWITG